MLRRSILVVTVVVLAVLSGAVLAAGGTASGTPSHGFGTALSSVQPGGPMGQLPGGAVPDVCCQTNSHWSGLAVGGGEFAFTSIGDAWTQPAVTCASGEQAAFWVGLDGYTSTSPTVEQTGTAVTCQGSTAVYQAWYELYPDPPVYFSNPVHPGDVITASVVYNQGFSYTLTISDSPQGWTQTVHASAPNAVRSSAEIIVEKPLLANGTYAPLADFGTASFGRAYINNKPITSYSPEIINIADSGGHAEDSVSETELGTFSVKWLSST